jgi:pyruvate/2-oxoglutarate/acetoin dehydrogenase E1 component
LKAAIRDNDPVISWNQNKCMVIKVKFQMASIYSNRVADIKREGTDVTSFFGKLSKKLISLLRISKEGIL